jgi:hypothetical protein
VIDLSKTKNLWIAGGASCLLLVLILQLALSVRRNSITWDEDDHIYAGYMSWKHTDFGLNPEHPPRSEFVHNLSRPREVRLLETVARFHLLPESYIYGLADVRIMSDFYASYLFGKVYPHGVWFYFPAAFLVKSSLTFLIFLLLTAWMIAVRRLRCWREILFLTIPPAFHLAVAMWSGMNIGVRHILSMYWFLAVLIGGAVWKLIERNWHWLYVVIALLVFQGFSSTRTFPAYLAYANELWGGPSQTYKYLSNANVDWGQQLKATKRYLDQRGAKIAGLFTSPKAWWTPPTTAFPASHCQLPTRCGWARPRKPRPQSMVPCSSAPETSRGLSSERGS